ncbi:hypothetical protein F0562_019503 [Nyssa sinensis]|uniref:Uncharacterized protein n=1 Tax=Nyssa sinensis TaxID=561372 RepID=A0A5J5BNR8_9ASTE|nr:hypothetical protein F0562_019503 [Nyssa sinensis]
MVFRHFFARVWFPLLSICNPIDESLVREFYVNLEIVCDQVIARVFVRSISFDLTHVLIVVTFGILREDQPSFPYAPGTTPREEVLARALHHDMSKVFQVIDIVRDLSGPFTKRTLTQSQCHVSLVDVDVAEDMEADAAEVGGAVPNEYYLIDHMPLQYRRDPSPPRPFYSNLGASSSNAPLPSVTLEDLEEYFQQLWVDFFILVL